MGVPDTHFGDQALIIVANRELQRVNDDLENQIHEDGGLIDRIVELEAEMASAQEALHQIKDFVYDPLNIHSRAYEEIRTIYREWAEGTI